MSKFGWSYPAGAANDPNAPYNQDDSYDDSIKQKIHWDIRRLVRNLISNEGLGSFYRACYKGSDCGISIGFEFNGEVICNDDLHKLGKCDHQFWLDNEFTGIMIKGHVEGSDVELQPVWFEESVTNEQFFENVDEIDKEAAFYWERDNSTWFYVDFTPLDKETTRYYGHECWGEITWDSENIPNYVTSKIESFFANGKSFTEYDPVALGVGIYACEYINDMEF